MTSIDSTYVLSVLVEARNVEEQRAKFYTTQPYPAMALIAEDHAYSLALLADVVNAGLLEQLHDQFQQNLFVDVADGEREAAWAKYLAGMTASPLCPAPLAVAFGATVTSPASPDDDALIRILQDGCGDGPVLVQVLGSTDMETREAWDTALVDQLLEWKDRAVQAALDAERTAKRDLAGVDHEDAPALGFHDTTAKILGFVYGEQCRDLHLFQRRLERADAGASESALTSFRNRIAELTAVVADFERLITFVESGNPAERAEDLNEDEPVPYVLAEGPADRPTLAEQLRAVGAEQAALDAEADTSAAERRAREAEAFDGSEVYDVLQIEHDMAVEAGMECDPETCADCGAV